MAHWLVVVSQDWHESERLYHHETLELPVEHGEQLTAGDLVAVASGDPLMVFGLGQVQSAPGAGRPGAGPDSDARPAVPIRYSHRLFDTPIPAPHPLPGAGPGASSGASSGDGPGAGLARPLDPVVFAAVAEQVTPAQSVTAPQTSWLVGVELPIEAASSAEAVRQFWSYVTALGPRELPAFVSPAGDELAMQAYVLGEEANLDPEEDDD